MVAMIVDAAGIHPVVEAEDLLRRINSGSFFWFDNFGGDGPTRSSYLSEIGFASTDITSVLRFGQAGRMHIGQQKLRAATWVASPNGSLIEIHVICCQQCIVTIWNGDGAVLDEIRQQYAERISGFDNSMYYGAGVLLQLLLGTLDHAIRNLDLTLEDLRLQLDHDSSSADFALLTRRLQKLQTVVASFDRYGSSVRTAFVGVETVPGMDNLGAAELNDYSEQVEDVEEQFYERRRWMSDMTHDYATAIVERQGEQINRLTLVSLIFLPVTALTGFFGMNFDWMNRSLESKEAFFLLGVSLPALCMIATILWLARRGLIQINFWPFNRLAPRARGIAQKAMPEARLNMPYPLTESGSPSGGLDGVLVVGRDQTGD